MILHYQCNETVQESQCKISNFLFAFGMKLMFWKDYAMFRVIFQRELLIILLAELHRP